MTTIDKSMHSICRWTFHSGKGGFVPSNIRPAWQSASFSSVDMIRLIRERIAPRLPQHIQLGVELHYDYEYDEKNAAEIADALVDSGLYLAMVTPGAHAHFAYGGIASLDPAERKKADTFGEKALKLAYGPLRKAWHPDKSPTLVIWNGSFGYDIASPSIKLMYKNLKESIAGLCRIEEDLGGKLFIGIEPKPNEGHPAMLIPTVASALLLWRKLEEEYGITRKRKGVNKEFGHTEMIGLDLIYDTVEELDEGAVVHMHLNSQGGSDGITLGGPGKFDIDHGVKINGINIAIAALLHQSSYSRWKGHDMQVRPYDTEEQGIDRVIRSILSWEACEEAARKLDTAELSQLLSARETARAEDMMRQSVADASKYFDILYRS